MTELTYEVNLRVTCTSPEEATQVTEKMMTIMNGHVLESRETALEVNCYEYEAIERGIEDNA